MSEMRLNRRDFLRLAAVGTGAVVAACAPAATPQVITQKVIETVVVKQEVAVEKIKEVPKEVVKEVVKEVEKLVTAVPVKAKVSFYFHGDASEADMYTATIQEFNKRDPNIQAAPVQIPSAEFKQKVQTMIAGGTPPDVFWLHATWFATFDKAKALLDLTPLIEADQFPIDAYYPSAVAQFTSGGKVYAIPRETSSVVFFYNKNMFDAAGLEYPTDKWTFDDVSEAAKKLTKRDAAGNATQFGILAPSTWIGLFNVITSFGGLVLDEPDMNKCVMGSEETIKAIQWTSDLINVHKVAPTTADLSAQGADVMFASNKVAMMWGIRANVAYVLRADPNFNFDIQHTPLGPTGGRACRLSSGAYAIPAGTKYPEAAWELEKYLTSRPVYDFLTNRGLIIPAYIPSATGEAMLGMGVKPPSNRIFLDALQYAKSEPITTVYPAMMDIINPEIEAVMLGKKSAADAVSAICPKVDELLKTK